MTAQHVLRFRAGPRALQRIREEGFSPHQIGTIAGASGGAKWLVLSQVDRVIADRILPELTGPVHLIGSSIGAWRFSCYAQHDPLVALGRLEESYIEQTYSDNPDIEEITSRSQEILETVLGTTGREEILTNKNLRAHVMAVRSRHALASEFKPLLASGLLMSAAANFLNRRTLGAFFSRALFYDPRDLPPCFDSTGFPIDRIELTNANYRQAVLASGAIPLVLRGVRDIAGAPEGVYRDGGIIDYHLDLQTSVPGRITLFPHFYDHLIPGWFDKKLKWRRHTVENINDTLLICPTEEFVAALPNGKIPDRTDFMTLSPDRRKKVWRQVVMACQRLAEDLNHVLDSHTLPARIEAL